MSLRQLAFGAATFIPGINQMRAIPTGGTDSARYCYSVWLRHLVKAKSNGLDPHPKTVGELGPGDSLGIGLAALISGSDRYFAFDVMEHASVESNLAIFEELVALFQDKAPIPASAEFPKLKPHLDKYDFPDDILDDGRLRRALESSRLDRIRDSISGGHRNDSLVQYKVPWYDAAVIEDESIDVLYSQAVLEHVDDLRGTYRAMRAWLKPSGYISHQIDFKCHGYAEDWNGHWAYSDFVWKVIRGRRPYLINREPHSTHVAMLAEEGFRIVCDDRFVTDSRVTISDLAPRFQSMSSEDLVTSAAFIQGVKKTPGDASSNVIEVRRRVSARDPVHDNSDETHLFRAGTFPAAGVTPLLNTDMEVVFVCVNMCEPRQRVVIW